MKISFKKDALSNIEFILKREWIEKNRNGCFAIQSIPGVNTKRFHGLFNLINKNTQEIIGVLPYLENTLVLNDLSYCLSSIQYSDQIFPDGYKLMSEFNYVTHPVFVYKIKDVEVEKELLILPDRNVLIVHYAVKNQNRGNKLRLVIKPFFSIKNILELKISDAVMAKDAYVEGDLVSYQPYSAESCYYLSATGSEYLPSPLWYYDFWHTFDKPEPSKEDYYNPGFFNINVEAKGGGDYYFVISDERITTEEAVILFEKEKARRLQKFSENEGDIFLPKVISGEIDKFIFKDNNEYYYQNFPFTLRSDINSFLIIFPILYSMDSKRAISIKLFNSVRKLLTKNFIPDAYKLLTKIKLFETPIPALSSVIAYYIGYTMRNSILQVLDMKKFMEEVINGILKNKYPRLKTDRGGWLTYIDPASEYYWYFPFGIQSFPCKIVLDEVFLNLMWYNTVSAFLDIHKKEKSIFNVRLGKLKKSLGKKLMNVEFGAETSDCSILKHIVALSLPFKGLKEETYEKLSREVKKNMTPFGLKVTINIEGVERIITLPIGLYIYLHYLNQHCEKYEFKKALDHYLLPGLNHLYDGAIMHYTEAFEIINGQYVKMGSNFSGINIIFFDAWYIKKIMLDKEIRAEKKRENA